MYSSALFRPATGWEADAISELYLASCKRFLPYAPLAHTLYLHPRAVGQGIGARLVELAQSQLGPPIRLYTFQANSGARRF